MKLSKTMIEGMAQIKRTVGSNRAVDGFVNVSGGTLSALVRRGLITWEAGESRFGVVTLTDTGLDFIEHPDRGEG